LDPTIYFLAEYYPWWGIPSALILAEIANHFRRTGHRFRFLACAALSLLMATLAVFYFTHSGFQNLRPAMQELERQYRQ
jgi:hypothetical protein